MTRDNNHSSYGELLGDFFTVASSIAELRTNFDQEELEENEQFTQLLEEKDHLQERLDEASKVNSDSEIKQVLDEALLQS